MTNLNYNPINLLAFNFAGFACISIVVFLSSTQPFFITEVIGIKQNEKIGSVIGTLGFFDELVAIVAAPLLGTLTDKMNRIPKFPFSGSRITQSLSLFLVAFSLLGYSRFSSSVRDLLVFRCIFAVGVTACMSMVTVTLNELTNSDFRFQKFIFWKHHDYLPIEDSETSKKNGKYAALIGISTGLGAIFAVSMFLTLPVRLIDRYPLLDMKSSLKLSYSMIATYGVVCGTILFVALYDHKRANRQAVSLEAGVYESELPLPFPIPTEESYYELLSTGLQMSKSNSEIQLSYIGAFVARSTTVATAVFIPLLVYNFYYDKGNCDSDYPSKNTCYDGYVFSAILTGVAQTVALVSSPFWAWIIDSDRFGKHKSLFLAAALGLFGNYGLCLFTSNTPDKYDPRTATCFIMVGFIGLSQIGIIITSMSLLSGLNKDPNMGSLSGLYSLSGGLGILILTKFGGMWSDNWILGPFFILGTFNLLLLIACLLAIRESKKSHHTLLRVR